LAQAKEKAVSQAKSWGDIFAKGEGKRLKKISLQVCLSPMLAMSTIRLTYMRMDQGETRLATAVLRLLFNRCQE
jgi:hypothetical protein